MKYEITFAPINTLTYTYEVEVNDPNNAEDVARNDFQIDIGYGYARDFEIIGVKEINND